MSKINSCPVQDICKYAPNCDPLTYGPKEPCDKGKQLAVLKEKAALWDRVKEIAAKAQLIKCDGCIMADKQGCCNECEVLYDIVSVLEGEKEASDDAQG